MFKNIKNEYSVKTTPLDDPEALEHMLNHMASEGWDLYTLNEAEGPTGKACYNCIFTRESEEDDSESEVVEVKDFKSKMEKMYEPSDEPFQKCRQIQRKIRDKHQRIEKIKNLLDSTTAEKEHQKLNEEISKSLKDLKELKTKLSEALEPEKLYEKIGQNKLSIVLSDELVDLVNPELEAKLVSQTVKTRQDLVEKLGYVIPAVHFTDSNQLEANEFSIQVRGVETLKGYVYPGHKMFFPGQANLTRKPKDAIQNVDCITGEKVYWIEESKTRDFWDKGLSAQEVISKALEYVSLKFVEEILDYSDINKYLEIAGSQNLYLIENLIPEYLSIGDLRYIFAQLIKEKVPIKDIIYIFERLNDFSTEEDKEDLLEKLRISLNRQISQSIADKNRTIYGIVLGDKITDKLEEGFFKDADVISVDINLVKSLLEQIRPIIQESEINASNIAIIVPVVTRQLIYSLFEQFLPDVSIIAKEEISPHFNLEILSTVDI